MNSEHCKLCLNTPEIICFCSSFVFCKDCIGLHLIEKTIEPHKPMVINQEITHLAANSLEKLKKSEFSILEQAAKSQETKNLIEIRLKFELKAVNEFQQTSTKEVYKHIQSLKDELDKVQSKILKSLENSCESLKKQLKLWSSAIKAGDLNYNFITESLSRCPDYKSMENTNITKKIFTLENLSIESLVFSSIHISIELEENAETMNVISLSPSHYTKIPDGFTIKPSDSQKTGSISNDELEKNDIFMNPRMTMQVVPDSFKFSGFVDEIPITSKSPDVTRRIQKSYTNKRIDYSKHSKKTVPKVH